MNVTVRTDDDAMGPSREYAQDEQLNQLATANRPRLRARHRRRLAESPRPTTSGVTGRLRLLAWSAFGIGCLLTAHWIQPEHRLLFALPSDSVGWASMLFGITGLWLVPGLWLSALVARTGSGQPAWLGTRIATTLIWYALAGPVINRAGEGAAVTTGGLIIMTVAATTAVLVGVAVGLSKWPKDPWVRTLAPALVGAACAQVAIWVSMRMWTSGMNYEHIRRLDWLIVMCCGLLVALGTMARPKMPPMRTRRDLVGILIALAVVAATVCSIRLSSSVWSPAQLMPSVLSAEQTTAPRGADLAFALTGFGPDGARLFDLADFIVSDDTGHRVPVSTSIERSEDAPNTATLLVVLMPDGRPLLCRSIGAAKLTVRDAASGVQIQAVVPHGWCTA